MDEPSVNAPGRRVFEICPVRGNRVVARDSVVLTVETSLARAPRAGQFAMVHPLRAGCLLARPFSILDYRPAPAGRGSDTAAVGELDLLVKVVGRGTRALAELRPGDPVRLLAPLGRWFDDPQLRQRRIVMVAGGVGIVPLHLLARELVAEGLPAPLGMFGARTPEDIPLELFDAHRDVWQLWVERGADPVRRLRDGLVTTGLLEALERQPDAVVATCGPTPMMKAVAGICRQRGVPLWLCLEEQMGCGAGVCRACVVPDAHEPRMRTVCREGPVFRLDEIAYV